MSKNYFIILCSSTLVEFKTSEFAFKNKSILAWKINIDIPKEFHLS